MNRSRHRLKESRASGSTVAKVARLLRLGWHPGLSVRDVLPRRRRTREGMETGWRGN